MTNFFDILKNVCLLAHEEIPLSFSDSTPSFSEIKQYIKNTLEEVCSRFNWTFRERIYTFETVIGQREYQLPSGLIPSNIIENGVRIEGKTSPLYFMFHNDLDSVAKTSGTPDRYSVYSSKLILDPVPDAVYSVQIKYLTSNYAFNSTKAIEKANLELETDVMIVPEKYNKVIEWGAYSLYRQNFKPDNKYKFARERFLEYLLDMQREDGYGNDAAPAMVMNSQENPLRLLLNDFFKPN